MRVIYLIPEELGTAYDEAYKYAEIAEGSRGDMEVLVQAMSRINETSEKIGAIITQIEDIASQDKSSFIKCFD